jgi:hypothetical protein
LVLDQPATGLRAHHGRAARAHGQARGDRRPEADRVRAPSRAVSLLPPWQPQAHTTSTPMPSTA